MLPGQDEWLNAGTILMMAGKTSLKIQNFALMHEGGQRRVGPWKEPQSPRKRWQMKMGNWNAVRCHGVRHACHGLA